VVVLILLRSNCAYFPYMSLQEFFCHCEDFLYVIARSPAFSGTAKQSRIKNRSPRPSGLAMTTKETLQGFYLISHCGDFFCHCDPAFLREKQSRCKKKYIATFPSFWRDRD
jgi:hypothetical protein